jgi:TPR repeat protein
MINRKVHLVQKMGAFLCHPEAIVLGLALALVGCGRAADLSTEKPTIQSGSRVASFSPPKLMSPAGSRILSLLLEDKQEAAKRLLHDFEDPSEGRAETEVLKAAVRITEAFSPKAQSEALVLRMVPMALRGRGGSVGQVREHLKLAIDLNPKWKPLAAELLIDLATAQLLLKAERGETVHCLSDTCLLSPKNAYYANEKEADSREFNGVVLGSLSINSDVTNLDINSVLAASLFRKQRDQYTDFLLGGSWCELFPLADEFSPGAVSRHSTALMEVAMAFAQRHLYTSALLMERIASRANPGTRAREYSQGLALLKACAQDAKHPACVQNLAVALGYWAESHPTEAKAAPEGEATAELLKSISARGGWCDAIVLAQHIGIPDLELPHVAPTFPWRDQKENHQAFLAAAAEKDPARMEQQLRPLADLGHAEAMFDLGSMLELHARRGTSAEQVLSLYRKACQAGLPEAAKRLGQLYESGNLVKADAQLALGYYRQAGNAGLPDALAYAAGVYLKNWRTPEATNLFVALHLRAAAAGSVIAMNQLATHYLDFKDARLDEKAVSLLQEAARRNYAPSQHNLGYCYLHGRGTAKDPVQGLHFTLMAATNGCPASMFQAALLYQDGTGTAANLKMREYWLTRAYEAGDPDAARVFGDREQKRRQQLAAMQRETEVRQQQQMAFEQARLEQQQASQQWMNQAAADVQERTARAMRRYNQAVVPGLAAQGVEYWRQSR